MRLKKNDVAEQLKWRRAVRRRAADPASADEDEMAFLSLPDHKRQAVIERLRVLDEYLDLPEPTVARVDEAAAKLGVARRTFYHLLGKLREHGAVKGLAPGYRVKQRPSVAKDGMGEVPERVLSQILRADPEAPLGQVYRAISQACRAEGAEEPNEAEVRLRLHELRRRGRSTAGQGTPVGRSLLIDQSPIDLALIFFERRIQAIATLIVDRETKLILGVGIAPADGGSDGLTSAIRNAVAEVIPRFSVDGVKFADRIEEVEFVVPPGLEGLGEQWLASSTITNSDVHLKVVDRRPKRHGFALVRLMGDRLGIHSFRTRTPVDPKSSATWPIAHRPEDALTVVRYAAEAWNRPILRKVAVTASPETVGVAKAAPAIATQLQDLFRPFLKLADSAGS